MNEQDEGAGRAGALNPRAIVILGLLSVAIYTAGLMFAAQSYDALVATLLGLALVIVSVPALSRQAARERDRRLFWLLMIALLVKLLLGAIGQIYVIFESYGGVADAQYYYEEGLVLAQQFRDLNFATGDPLIGKYFINFLTGIVMAVIGPSRSGGFMFFSWMGFWGLFFLYRAFVIAVPEGRSRTYARLVFFLPSSVFWPSAIGKDAWMLLALGIAAFGSARLLSGQMWRGLPMVGLGFWMGGMVRPHVVAFAGVALAAAYLIRRPGRALRELAPVVKGVSLIAVAVVALILISRSNAFLQRSGFENPTDVTSSLNTIYGRTSRGGSAFVPSVLTTPQRAPAAAVTVLFRPILTDAENLQEFIAALEGTLLLLFAIARIRWIIASLRSVRRQPFVLLALVYAGVFVAAFSSVANYGLLVRQRSSVLPFFLLLLAIPPNRKLLVGSDEPGLATEVSRA